MRRASGLISEIVDLVTHGTVIAAVVRFQCVNLDACSVTRTIRLRSELNVHVFSEFNFDGETFLRVGFGRASSQSTAHSIRRASIQKVTAHALARIRRANWSSERCADVLEKEVRVLRISN